MIRVPYADFAFGQYNHSVHKREIAPLEFFKKDAKLAHLHGLSYVASINANLNSINNLEFFKLYNQLCKLEKIDFITSWQWFQRKDPYPSFQERLEDSDPRVQAEISKISENCR